MDSSLLLYLDEVNVTNLYINYLKVIKFIIKQAFARGISFLAIFTHKSCFYSDFKLFTSPMHKTFAYLFVNNVSPHLNFNWRQQIIILGSYTYPSTSVQLFEVFTLILKLTPMNNYWTFLFIFHLTPVNNYFRFLHLSFNWCLQIIIWCFYICLSTDPANNCFWFLH